MELQHKGAKPLGAACCDSGRTSLLASFGADEFGLGFVVRVLEGGDARIVVSAEGWCDLFGV